MSNVITSIKDNYLYIGKGALGEELQFNNEILAGSVLLYKEQIAHFSAFVKQSKRTLPQYEYENKVA